MNEIEKKEYRKAYVELNEIIKMMSLEEKQKIPKSFIQNLNHEMDKDYKFVIDNKKNIFEQNFKVETKALLVELYERYLAPSEEKDLWERYDRMCLNEIEENKRKMYDPNKIFEDKNQKSSNIKDTEKVNDNLPVEIKENNIFLKILRILRKKFNIKK